MGYTTDFQGRFECHPPLDQDQVNYLQAFNNTRRMARNPDLLDQDPLREAVGLPAGRFGDFYVAGTGSFGHSQLVAIMGVLPCPEGVPPIGRLWRRKFYC